MTRPGKEKWARFSACVIEYDNTPQLIIYEDGFIITRTEPCHLTQASPPLLCFCIAMSPSYIVIGTPFSTFTRAITSALSFKGIHFEQKATAPHTELARKYHPFGFIPVLVVTEVGLRNTISLGRSHSAAKLISRVVGH